MRRRSESHRFLDGPKVHRSAEPMRLDAGPWLQKLWECRLEMTEQDFAACQFGARSETCAAYRSSVRRGRSSRRRLALVTARCFHFTYTYRVKRLPAIQELGQSVSSKLLLSHQEPEAFSTAIISWSDNASGLPVQAP